MTRGDWKRRFLPLPDGLVERILTSPDVRPHAVARARHRLAVRRIPAPPRVVASSVLDHHLGLPDA